MHTNLPCELSVEKAFAVQVLMPSSQYNLIKFKKRIIINGKYEQDMWHMALMLYADITSVKGKLLVSLIKYSTTNFDDGNLSF